MKDRKTRDGEALPKNGDSEPGERTVHAIEIKMPASLTLGEVLGILAESAREVGFRLVPHVGEPDDVEVELVPEAAEDDSEGEGDVDQ